MLVIKKFTILLIVYTPVFLAIFPSFVFKARPRAATNPLLRIRRRLMRSKEAL